MDDAAALAHCVNYRNACRGMLAELDSQPVFIRESAKAKEARRLATASLALVSELERRCREGVKNADAE